MKSTQNLDRYLLRCWLETLLSLLRRIVTLIANNTLSTFSMTSRTLSVFVSFWGGIVLRFQRRHPSVDIFVAEFALLLLPDKSLSVYAVDVK
jgi:hypothetical protein